MPNGKSIPVPLVDEPLSLRICARSLPIKALCLPKFAEISTKYSSALLISQRLTEALELKRQVLSDEALLARAAEVAKLCIEALRAGGAVYWCGNGGSAADAQHLAAELTGRFYYDRPPLRSEALHVNTSYLTAVGNDYGYEQVFERLVRGHIRPGDVLIGLSTSGNSRNVVLALAAACELGATAVAFTGEGGGAMAAECSLLIDVPSRDTPRIQEIHMFLGHCICEIVESEMFPRSA